MLKIKNARRNNQRQTNLITYDLPLFYRNQQVTATEVQVIALIPKGEDSKVTMTDLARLASLDTRTVQNIISSAKKKGVPILSSRKAGDSGYYIATTEEERRRGLATLRHQIKEISAGIEGVEGADLDQWQHLTGFNEQLEKIMKRK